MKALSRSRKGFILVSVLVLGTLLISAATTLAWFARTQARTFSSQTIAFTNRTFAHVISTSVIKALSMIFAEVKYDSPTQRWYQPFIIAPQDMGAWVIKITPLDDKLPLRQLFLPDGSTLRGELSEVWHEMFMKLNANTGTEQILLDFMDRDKKPRVGSVERDDFLNRPPYDISELLFLSRDIDPELFAGIEDYCTVFSDGKININVAPEHVIELIPGLDTGGAAQSVIKYREDNPIDALSTLQKIPGLSARTSNQVMNIIGFESRYFELTMEHITDNEGVSKYSIIFDRTSKQIIKWEES